MLLTWTVTANGSQPNLPLDLVNGDVQKTSIHFELFHDYLIVLHGSAGPIKGLNFLLDTGATPSVLEPSLAARLALHTTPIDIAVLQGTTHGASATLPDLRIGPVSRTDFPILIEDLSFVQKVVPVHLDGIVGLDVLGQSPFVIDYASRKIVFGPIDLPSLVPLQLDHGLAMLSAMVNERPAQLLLDTGAPSLILFRSAADAHVRLVSSDSIGDHEEGALRLATLTLGSATIRHPSAFVVTNDADAGHHFAGLLSPAGLGLTRIAIDLQHGEMAFSTRP
jgi:hypothetical protein